MRRSIALACLVFIGCTSSTTPPTDLDGDVADSGTTDDAGDAGDDAEVVVVLPPPVCEGDTDGVTAFFEMDAIEIPRMSDPQGIGGFNIDGLISKKYTVEGCGFVDDPGGVDNAFAYTAVTVNNLVKLIDPNIDIYNEIGGLLDSGALSIELTLQHWNGTRNDEAVGMLITLESGNVMQQVLGCGRMVNGLIEGTFELPVSLGFSLGTTSFALELRSPRIRLAVAEDGQSIDVASSYIGGYVLWDDGTPVTLPGELKAQIKNVIPMNIPPALVNTLLSQIRADIDGYPTLGVCVSTDTGVSADSLSMALRLGGTRVMP